MTNKKAVIDIGTNTFHLLIANVDDNNHIEVIYKNTIAVKLGEGGVNKGYITPEAYKRGIDALLLFRTALDENQMDSVKATATAAVRGASNGQLFIDEALAKANIKIDLIDGLKEAEYIYAGAKCAGVLNDNIALIMDIGGGSVEFIICNQQQVFWKKSYLLGAARLLADYYQQETAIEQETLAVMNKFFELTLSDLISETKKLKPLMLIGTAGAFDSFANIIAVQKNTSFDAGTAKSYDFNFTAFNQLLTALIASTHQQRKQMDGLIPLRVDMILMASILTQFVLNETQIEEIQTCSYSLKEGLILSAS